MAFNPAGLVDLAELIFIPREPKKLLGFIPIHGVLHTQRENVTRDYARILANDLFSADVLLDAILHGPTSERLFAAIEKEVSAALDAQAGVAQPLMFTVGAVLGFLVGELQVVLVEQFAR